MESKKDQLKALKADAKKLLLLKNRTDLAENNDVLTLMAKFAMKTKTQKKPDIIYLSGKITGEPIEECKAKFEKYEGFVAEAFDCEIINPLKIEGNNDQTKDWIEYMERDIAELLKCNSIFMLPCWRESKGARIEHAIAEAAGMRIIYLAGTNEDCF